MSIHIAVPEHVPTNLTQRIKNILSEIPILNHSDVILEYQQDGERFDSGDTVRVLDPDSNLLVLTIALPKFGLGNVYKVYRVALTITSASDHFPEISQAVREKLCSVSRNESIPCLDRSQDFYFAPYCMLVLAKRPKAREGRSPRISPHAYVNTSARHLLKLSNKDLALCLLILQEAQARCEQCAITAHQVLTESGILSPSVKRSISHILQKAQNTGLLRKRPKKIGRVVVHSLTEEGHAFVAKHLENN